MGKSLKGKECGKGICQRTVSYTHLPVSSVYEPVVAPAPFQPQVIEHQELPSTPPQIKFCRKCGNKLIEGSEFCSSCGTKVLIRL